MAKSRRIIILGIDGMDPEVFQYLHDKGRMPVLGAIAREGNFRILTTSNPSQSPVSWTSIATGQNPGTHGIFDFLHRNPKNYMPELSLFVIESHKGGVRYRSSVRSPSVFERAMEKGIPVILLRWPLTFPAPELSHPESRLLPGMGVPDLFGTLGRYTFYTADHTISEGDKRGRIVHISPKNGVVKTEIYGPRYLGWKGMKEATVPMTLEQTREGMKVILPDNILQLNAGVWSPHVIIRFSTGLIGKISAVTRMVCIDSKPFPSLFMLPLQIYPKDTSLPLSSPPSFGKELWDRIGPYLTLGMPEDTNGLNDGLIPENVFLDLCSEVFAERERMFFASIREFNEGIFACVIDALDRIQHMFWQDRNRGIDTGEPTAVVTEWYQRIDDFIGRVIEHTDRDIPILILSDHGFSPLDTYVHLNTWLVQNGFMALKDNAPEGKPLFEGVDWSRTTAYAVGFSSIYLNIKGREGNGIVRPDEADIVQSDLARRLIDWAENGKPVVKKVYRAKEIFSGEEVDNGPDLVIGYQRGYRASKETALGQSPAGKTIKENHEPWCGDHCCDPSFVPGVLFGINLHKAGIELPETVSVEDISLMIEEWMR